VDFFKDELPKMWLGREEGGWAVPLFIIIGYLVRYQHPTGVIPFLSNLGMVEKLGLAGLILTALFGMYLSRTNSVEA
jgi:hypothetical protein